MQNFRDYITDEMTPLEREEAIMRGAAYDRIRCVPYMGDVKRKLTDLSDRDYWMDASKMLTAELEAFKRFNMDRVIFGPDSRWTTAALTGSAEYREVDALGSAAMPGDKLDQLLANGPAEKSLLEEMAFAEVGKGLMDEIGDLVRVEMNIGGPVTVAAGLYGPEKMLRDLRKRPERVLDVIGIVLETQKRWIDIAAECGTSVMISDPVSGPVLIGVKAYDQLIRPATADLIAYASEKTGSKPSLLMSGETENAWDVLGTYDVHELGIDCVDDLGRAAEKLGQMVPIAGNIDVVHIMRDGSIEAVREAAKDCLAAGEKAPKGYTLATSAEIEYATPLENIDALMAASRAYGKR